MPCAESVLPRKLGSLASGAGLCRAERVAFITNPRLQAGAFLCPGLWPHLYKDAGLAHLWGSTSCPKSLGNVSPSTVEGSLGHSNGAKGGWSLLSFWRSQRAHGVDAYCQGVPCCAWRFGDLLVHSTQGIGGPGQG